MALIGVAMVASSSAAPGVRMAGLVTLLASTFALWRALRLALVGSPQGILIRDWVRDRSYEWSDVDSIDLHRCTNILPTVAVCIVARDGRSDVAQVTAQSVFVSRRTRLSSAVVELQKMLQGSDG